MAALTMTTRGAFSSSDGRERASGHDRDLHRPEVIGADDVVVDLHRLAGAGTYPSMRIRIDGDRSNPSGTRRASATDDTPGSAPTCSTRRSMELTASRLVVAVREEIVRRKQDAAGVESWRHLLRVRETAHEQAGGDEQQHRERHLHDHEPMAKAGAGTAAGRTCLVLQIGDHVGSSALQRGDEAEDEASRQREHAGEREHAEHPRRSSASPGCRWAV